MSTDEPRHSAPPFESLLVGELVSISIGNEENPVQFYLPEGLLCGKSDYFRKALQGSFREAHKKTIAFPEDHPEAFAYYVSFLYNPTNTFLLSVNGPDDLSRALKLYTFVSKICERGLQDTIITAVYEKIGYTCETTHLRPHHTHYIYQNTITGDRMRLLLTETLAICATGMADSINFLNGWGMDDSSAGELGFDIIKFINKHVKRTRCGDNPQCESCRRASKYSCFEQLPLLPRSDISEILAEEDT